MRHGRKNRALLRQWKIDSGHADPLDARPPTERPRELTNYTNRPLLVMTGGTRNAPILEWIEYDEIVRRNQSRRYGWISTRSTKRFGRDATLEQRCWLSGVQIYFVPSDFLDVSAPPPWMVSREHLVCARNGGEGHGETNLAFLGASVNKKIGHVPLPVKLLHRRELATRKYSRDDPSWSTYHYIREAIIEIELPYQLGAAYPWQPWAFAPGTREFRIASSFFEEMLAAEREFLALDPVARQQWLDEFRWRW